jgi:hypothetical protein
MRKRPAIDSENLSINKTKSIKVINRDPHTLDYHIDFLMAIKKSRFAFTIPNYIKLYEYNPLYYIRSCQETLQNFINMITNLKSGENPPYFSVISGSNLTSISTNFNCFSQLAYALKLKNGKYSIWLYTYSHKRHESYITPLCANALYYVKMKYKMLELDFTMEVLNFDATQITLPNIDYLLSLWNKVCPYMDDTMFYNFIENCDPLFKEFIMTKFKHQTKCKCMICDSNVTTYHYRKCLSDDDITYIKSAYNDCKPSTHVHAICWTQLVWFQNEFSQIM